MKSILKIPNLVDEPELPESNEMCLHKLDHRINKRMKKLKTAMDEFESEHGVEIMPTSSDVKPIPYLRPSDLSRYWFIA